MMKLPNNYGTVYKLSGKRRRPWVARKMIGKELVPETRRTKVLYYTVGYFATRSEALQALAAYNANPAQETAPLTFSDVFEAWNAEYSKKIKVNRNYKAARVIFDPIAMESFADLKLDHYQMAMNVSGKNAPMLKVAKSMLSLMYEYAVVHEIVPQSKRDMIRYLDKGTDNPNKLERRIFTPEEISALWADTSEYVNRLTLILIYTGMRISELTYLTTADIDLNRQSIVVRKSKTEAGVRELPIADRIVPLVKQFVHDRRYDPNYFRVLMREQLNDHRPHDTRHTFATLLAEAGIDQRVVDALMGHSPGKNIAQAVYTHITLEKKLEAVNTIC